MQRWIFHLDLDAFYVAVERCLDPDLAGKPVVISGGTARSVVSAASYEARALGVKSAMPFSQARRLCPQAVVLPGNFPAYHHYSKTFFSILARTSPELEPVSLDEAYLDYTHSQTLFGPPLPAAEKIQHTVGRELGLDVSIGISSSKLVSKLASDLAKPAGILLVRPGHEEAWLAPLDIRRLLGVGPKSEPRFRALGIHCIGDLRRFSEKELNRHFGNYGPGLPALARGRDDSPVVARDEVKSISQEETFLQDRREIGFLRQTLHAQVAAVAERLRSSGLQARTVFVKIRYPDFSLHTRSHTLATPANLDPELYGAALPLLDALLENGRALRLLGFGVQALTGPSTQLPLWQNPGSEKLRKLYQAADQVRKRHGAKALQSADRLRPQKGG